MWGEDHRRQQYSNSIIDHIGTELGALKEKGNFTFFYEPNNGDEENRTIPCSKKNIWIDNKFKHKLSGASCIRHNAYLWLNAIMPHINNDTHRERCIADLTRLKTRLISFPFLQHELFIYTTLNNQTLSIIEQFTIIKKYLDDLEPWKIVLMDERSVQFAILMAKEFKDNPNIKHGVCLVGANHSVKTAECLKKLLKDDVNLKIHIVRSEWAADILKGFNEGGISLDRVTTPDDICYDFNQESVNKTKEKMTQIIKQIATPVPPVSPKKPVTKSTEKPTTNKPAAKLVTNKPAGRGNGASDGIPFEYRPYKSQISPSLYKDTNDYVFCGKLHNNSCNALSHKDLSFNGKDTLIRIKCKDDKKPREHKKILSTIVANIQKAVKTLKPEEQKICTPSFVQYVMEFARRYNGVANATQCDNKKQNLSPQELWKEFYNEKLNDEEINNYIQSPILKQFNIAKNLSAAFQRVSCSNKVYSGREDNLRTDKQIGMRLKRIPQTILHKIKPELNKPQARE